jgi:hypothetical protein
VNPKRNLAFANVVLLALLSTCASTQALELITAKEAALPNAPKIESVATRVLTRAPSVSLVLPPPEGGAVQSPIELKVLFESHGGSRIDVNTVKITYLKMPLIDLTERVARFITATGFDVTEAELPPGTHFIRVDVTDVDGRSGSNTFSLTVLK